MKKAWKSDYFVQDSSKSSDLRLELELSSVFANETYFSNLLQDSDYTENLDESSQIIDTSLNNSKNY